MSANFLSSRNRVSALILLYPGASLIWSSSTQYRILAFSADQGNGSASSVGGVVWRALQPGGGALVFDLSFLRLREGLRRKVFWCGISAGSSGLGPGGISSSPSKGRCFSRFLAALQLPGFSCLFLEPAVEGRPRRRSGCSEFLRDFLAYALQSRRPLERKNQGLHLRVPFDPAGAVTSRPDEPSQGRPGGHVIIDRCSQNGSLGDM